MANSYANDFTTTVKTYYKDISKCQPLTKDEEKSLMKRAKSNDIVARNKILTSNLKFVFSIAKKYKGRGASMDDLISEGNLGLIHAYDKFDTNKDVKFFSYAVWWINWYMQEYIRKKNMVDENEVSDEEITSVTSNTNGDVNNYENENEETINLPDILITDTAKENEEKDSKQELLKHLIGKLNHRERVIIESYFGLTNGKPKTLEECGTLLGLSAERCRQIKVRSLMKMRSELLLLM